MVYIEEEGRREEGKEKEIREQGEEGEIGRAHV